MVSWRMVSCAAALRDRYQLCDIYDPLGSNATISGLYHRQRPNRLQHPQFSGVGMPDDVGKRGGRSEPRPWAKREPWRMGARGVRRGRPVVARLCLDAFPGGNPWQVLRSMHPESGLGRENRQFAARFARHASESGLALARYARHASEMPRKSPLEDAPREDPARKGHFSLHGSLESCTARRSCHPPPNSASDRSHGAAEQHGTARAAHNHAAALMAARHPQHSRCQRQPHRKRSHTPPPRDTEASGGREILRRPSSAAPKRNSGPTAP